MAHSVADCRPNTENARNQIRSIDYALQKR